MNKIYFLLLTWSCYFFDETTSLRSLDNIWVTTKHYSFLDIWDSMSLPCHFLVHFLTCTLIFIANFGDITWKKSNHRSFLNHHDWKKARVTVIVDWCKLALSLVGFDWHKSKTNLREAIFCCTHHGRCCVPKSRRYVPTSYIWAQSYGS